MQYNFFNRLPFIPFSLVNPDFLSRQSRRLWSSWCDGQSISISMDGCMLLATDLNKRIEIELWMYKRYVDDVNSIMGVPQLGMRFDGDKLVRNEVAAEEDRSIEADERAMRLFKSVANSIHPSIETEIDCPSRHDDHKLPILDLIKSLD